MANQFDAGSNEIAARDGYRGGDNNGTNAENSAQRFYQAQAADAIEASAHRNAGV
ncbi:hypothetical protein [Martelella lutilitoris]|uniref:hypothetical protein n=1 Tax=Martelella lutilitoris TaxID=2583532 RepID=UPI001FEA1486|nr:hypothetical protein [Martelella lutilitoris]